MHCAAQLQRSQWRPVEPKPGKEGDRNTGTQEAFGSGSEEGLAQDAGWGLLA